MFLCLRPTLLRFLRLFKKKIDPKALDDAHLLAHYQESRDLDAIAELFNRYAPLVLGICYKLLQEKYKAKDASMDIFLELKDKALRHKIEKFKPWLMALSRNFCLNKLRKTQPNIVSLSDSEEILENTVHFSMEMHHLFEEDSTDEVSILHQELKKLSNQQQECIRLFYFKKMSYQAIADQLGLDKGMVRSSIQNGRNRLRNLIMKHRKH